MKKLVFSAIMFLGLQLAVMSISMVHAMNAWPDDEYAWDDDYAWPDDEGYYEDEEYMFNAYIFIKAIK